MKLDKIWTVSFSPTSNSQRVVNAIASGLQGIPIQHVDLTLPAAASAMQFGTNDLVVIGVPVYAGRVAPLAVKRLQGIVGNSTPAVLVVTYGNREFDDALIELKDITENIGFKPIAACAFIGEHAFSSPETPIAAGRPDPQDLKIAESFGIDIGKKLQTLVAFEAGHCPEIPGNHPYKEGMGQLPFSPTLRETQCTQCASCISACPTGAISLKSKIEIDRSLCILCCSCIKNCPEDALEMDAAPLKQKRQWLYEQCRERKEPQLYL